MRGGSAHRLIVAVAMAAGVAGTEFGGGAAPAGAASWTASLNGSSSAESQSASAPSPPSGATATCPSATSNTVNVTWSSVPQGTSYSVYQSSTASTGPYSLAASGLVATSWTGSGLSSGNYWFEVSVYEGRAWQSANSAATAESTVVKSGNVRTCVQP